MTRVLKSDIRYDDIDSTRRTKEHRQRLREGGYDDGLTGRERRSTDQEYLVSYRRGREARRSAIGGERL